ncbi:MAG: TPM domain-containing protein [Alphaproteobacteria bacterium]|nr:TPM domain-containing protein [Alphaproteobacteria bacterium]MDE2113146.1 TPM domain-containing protein [Alphaproteobacteria bacterium]MDE2494017.1 TPM domain-containing protein [Alphaproteobacteria bacterium]
MTRPARNFAQTLIVALVALVLAAGAACAAPSFPPLTGRVVDDAGVLSQDTQQKLTGLLAEMEQQTGDQIVVVTLKSLQGYDIATYGYQLGRAWGIGQKGKNNGALIIVAPNERKARVEVGYGLEGDLTDAQSALIVQNTMLPYFRKGDYDDGVLAATVQVVQALGGKPSNADSLPQPLPDQQQQSHGGGIPIFVIMIIIWIVFGRFFWPLLFLGGLGGIGRGGPWGGGGFGGGSFGGGSFGGGFSGGGGSFGGGGASGSW